MPELTDIGALVEVGASIATIVALSVGGLWTYFLFIHKRVKYPHAVLAVEIEEIPLAENKRLIRAAAKITNIGNVVIRPHFAEHRLRLVVPLPKELIEAANNGLDIVREGENSVEWPLIAQREWNWAHGELEIEPQEHETLYSDYVLDSSFEVVEFYCYVRNRTKNEIGWRLRCIYKMGSKETKNDQEKD